MFILTDIVDYICKINTLQHTMTPNIHCTKSRGILIPMRYNPQIFTCSEETRYDLVSVIRAKCVTNRKINMLFIKTFILRKCCLYEGYSVHAVSSPMLSTKGYVTSYFYMCYENAITKLWHWQSRKNQGWQKPHAKLNELAYSIKLFLS